MTPLGTRALAALLLAAVEEARQHYSRILAAPEAP